jgi:hypothetical protein
VVLDLSAPKLLIPENFEDKNAAIIVVDFGKFLLTNQPGDHAPGQARSFFSFLEKCRLKGLSHELDLKILAKIYRTRLYFPYEWIRRFSICLPRTADRYSSYSLTPLFYKCIARNWLSLQIIFKTLTVCDPILDKAERVRQQVVEVGMGHWLGGIGLGLWQSQNSKGANQIWQPKVIVLKFKALIKLKIIGWVYFFPHHG